MLAKTPEQTVVDWLYAQTGGIVQSGPFASMRLPREQGWETGALAPAILGCHEQELHEAIEREIARLSTHERPRIVNIGTAEGYYAVGMAMRLPQAAVWGIDTNDGCVELAKKSAEENGVVVTFGDALDTVFEKPDLIISDCEGFEVAYLDLHKFPSLRNATMIVEIHGTHLELEDRFKETHDIEVVMEGGRDPNAFEMLRRHSSAFRWIAICENRPCMMHWLVMRPKTKSTGET